MDRTEEAEFIATELRGHLRAIRAEMALLDKLACTHPHLGLVGNTIADFADGLDAAVSGSGLATLIDDIEWATDTGGHPDDFTAHFEGLSRQGGLWLGRMRAAE